MVRLGHDSRDILGYQPLHRKAVAGGNRLANTLIELGIEVLSPEAILEYQMKLGRPNHELIRMIAQGMGTLSDDEDIDDEEDDEEEDDRGEDDDDDDDEIGDEEEPPKKKASPVTNFRWDRTNIQVYTKPIPPHVLAKAIEIKKALPTTEFYVEELRRVEDPFLVVTFGAKPHILEQFYIEVWEEPTFEGRATKDATSKSRKPKR